jgi:hypothetical protein
MLGPKCTRSLATAALACLAILTSGQALAHGHYEVDDAELIDPRSCEAEIWYTRFDGGDHATFLSPTCRRDADFQVTGTVGFLHGSGEGGEIYGIEGKTLFADLDSRGYGLGLVAGAEYLTTGSRWETVFTYVPFSVELIPDRAVFHANLGLERDRGEDDATALTWGVATEATLAGPLGLVAEVFGDDRSGSDPVLQIGPRLSLIEDRLSLDLTYTRELGGDNEEAYTVSVSLVVVNF